MVFLWLLLSAMSYPLLNLAFRRVEIHTEGSI